MELPLDKVLRRVDKALDIANSCANAYAHKIASQYPINPIPAEAKPKPGFQLKGGEEKE